MKKLLKNKFLNITLYGIELIGFIALLVLEYLSGYKAGVMKHLYFKKMEYLAKVYTQNAITMHSIIVLVLCVALLLIYKRGCRPNRKISIIMVAVYSMVLITAFYMPYMKELNTYAYTLVVLETAIGIETIRIIINK